LKLMLRESLKEIGLKRSKLASSLWRWIPLQRKIKKRQQKCCLFSFKDLVDKFNRPLSFFAAYSSKIFKRGSFPFRRNDQQPGVHCRYSRSLPYVT
jgi:hypothetical protein